MLVSQGVLGGVFNSLAAPVLFTGIAEYPIAILATALFAGLARGPGAKGTARPLDLLAPLVVVALYHEVPDLIRWLGLAPGALKTSLLGDPLEIGWTELLQAALPALAGLAFLRRPSASCSGSACCSWSAARVLPATRESSTPSGPSSASTGSSWSEAGRAPHGRQYLRPPGRSSRRPTTSARARWGT